MEQYSFDKQKTLCFTGHRSIPSADMGKLVKALDSLIEKAYADGYRCFIAGGALGFDTVAAFRVLGARDKYGDIELVLALPCINQTEKWKSEKSLTEYETIKKAADRVIYVNEEYTDGCMLERNRFMVDRSSRCISYLTRTRGGSAYTSNYAKKNGVECFNCADVMKTL